MAKRRGEVVAVRDLFGKYKNSLIAPEATVELEMIRVVGEILGVTLKENQVSYTVSTRTLSLTASGMIKQEIKLREKEVLKELVRRLGVKNSPQAII